ncbi:MAG: hypothetical protein KAS92_06710 [Candidatus Omnitrophica bacterium]|nr:hypothetical protein [Candidatus Omnitrophota bacterium]
MNISPTIDLVMQLAGREAIAGQFKEIEPEHFLMAILKFAELTSTQLDQIAPEFSKLLNDELTELCALLDGYNLCGKTTQLRRTLRKNIGRGNHIFSGGVIHRTDASRKLFSAARNKALSDHSNQFKAGHLLDAIFDAPTPKMNELLGDIQPKAISYDLPEDSLLALYGNEITLDQIRLDSEKTPRIIEGKNLYNLILNKGNKGVFIVSDDFQKAREVVDIAAHGLIKNAEKQMDRFRLIDLSSLAQKITDKKDYLAVINDIYLESLEFTQCVVVLPLPKPFADLILKILKTTVGNGKLRTIGIIGPESYQTWIENDYQWKKDFDTMWVHEEASIRMPSEL